MRCTPHLNNFGEQCFPLLADLLYLKDYKLDTGESLK